MKKESFEWDLKERTIVLKIFGLDSREQFVPVSTMFEVVVVCDLRKK